MYYIGLDVHKKSISFCVKDVAGRVLSEGEIRLNRCELDAWVKKLPQPRMIAMESRAENTESFMKREDCHTGRTRLGIRTDSQR